LRGRHGADPPDPPDLRQLLLRDGGAGRIGAPPHARRRGRADRRGHRDRAAQGAAPVDPAPTDRPRAGSVPRGLGPLAAGATEKQLMQLPGPLSPATAAAASLPLVALLLAGALLACDPGARTADDPSAAGERVEAGFGMGAPALFAAPAQQAAAQELDASRRTAIVTASRRVSPSVVTVNVIRREVVRPAFFDIFMFGPVQREVTGLGSGFVLREDGLILTNEHVVRDAQQVVVTLPDGRDFEAEVLGVDEATDLALL